MTRSRKRTSSVVVSSKIDFKPKTLGQKYYIDAIENSTVVYATGPAGTGKSYIALGMACKYLQAGKAEKILIARPTVEASPRGLGYIKGSLEEKFNPYVQPAIANMKKILGEKEYYDYFSAGAITFEPLEYMRGMTYDKTIMILEEAQNTTLEQLKMFITRLGEDSLVFINGDIQQTDLHKRNNETDFEYLITKTKKLDNFSHVVLTEADIVRNKIIGPFLKALGE